MVRNEAPYMNIISQKPPIVKWTEHKIQNQFVANRMLAAGFAKRGRLMLDCGTILSQKVCPDCGKSFISSANLCRDRMCPTCSWRLSLKRFAEMCAVCQTCQDIECYKAGFLTLTVRNCKPKDLKETLRSMSAAWNRMLSAAKKHKDSFAIYGWARSVEITYNEQTYTFHPHYHIIVLLDPTAEEGKCREFFYKKWSKAWGADYDPIIDYREIEAEKTDIDQPDFTKAILETYKYAIKSEDLIDMPTSIFRTLVLAISGARLVAFGGIIKEARRMLNYTESDDPEDVDEDVDRERCDCGAPLQAALLRWSFEESAYKKMATHLQESPIGAYLQ